ncbi:universal stress protein [Pseudonocardia sp. GCM10023141]|uniref:universal stress protein n=1 Tax=Pseudonocardia sp. GCM10023141 TaxID=3252653 RepID=UPI003621B1C8
MITAGSPVQADTAQADTAQAVTAQAVTAQGGGQGLVVVGVDDAPQAQAALAWAVVYAQRTGARIHAVTAWSATPQLVAGPELVTGGGMSDPLTDQHLQVAAEERLSMAIAALPLGTAELVERSALPGDPATVLVEAARDAELLVLGNAGRGALASAVTGSVAARCAHHAPCPVVLVPDPARCARDEE